MLFLPKLICLEARSTIKGAPGILARILGGKAFKQAGIARVRVTDRSRNPVNAIQKDEAACLRRSGGSPPCTPPQAPVLFTLMKKITVDEECQETRAHTSLAAAARLLLWLAAERMQLLTDEVIE
jgi:hypothetical protein